MTQTLDTPTQTTAVRYVPCELCAFYDRTAALLADALARKDWDAIHLLDLEEGAIMARDAETQFVPEPIIDEEEDEDTAREWCAAFDLDAAA